MSKLYYLFLISIKPVLFIIFGGVFILFLTAMLGDTTKEEEENKKEREKIAELTAEKVVKKIHSSYQGEIATRVTENPQWIQKIINDVHSLDR